ncbi:MAG: pyridine nucleotide-disulfide oxidoreductase [Gordonia sp.]|nr:pyridine nucleotide-disulfide oxidoreductase [Gordonia sp. (in: high G+C Gram-positive bacteria)]
MPQLKSPSGESVVIIGAGQAGLQTAVSLRSKGFTGSIVVVGEEAHEPYQRPPLSKSFISSAGGHEEVRLRPSKYYVDQCVSLSLGTRATNVDRKRREVALSSGDLVRYDHLVIATGVRARKLPVAGGHLQGVTTIRGLDDAVALRSRLRGDDKSVTPPPIHIAVIGGGFIGMEFAAMASGLGFQVTVIEANHRTLARATSPEVSDHLEHVHAEHGTQVLVGQSVRQLLGEAGRVTGVELQSGSVVAADLVVVGVGVEVNTEFLASSGFDLQHGVPVDAHLRTTDPYISAIGDCAYYPSLHGHRNMRIESVQNAVDQGRYVAERLLDLTDEPYTSVPWFWTHQFTEKVQIAGIASADDTRIVCGDRATGSYSVLHLSDDRLTCVESVNCQKDHMAARKAIGLATTLSSTDVLRQGFSLPEFVKSATQR